jgi:serine/threonine protein kinase
MGIAHTIGLPSRSDTTGCPREQNLVPFRWAALEVLEAERHSKASDVWSFGILLYEIFTYAAQPYTDWGSKKIQDELKLGYRLPLAQHMPEDVYEMLVTCWETDGTYTTAFPKQ